MSITIEQQLNELVKQKAALEDSLKSKGVEIGENETLNTLVEKVDNLETGGGGTSVGLNIHYGDTAPEDTSMLWVKCDEPSGVKVTDESLENSESLITLSTTLPQSMNRMGVATVDTDIYIFGGYNLGTCYDTIYKFDTITETLTMLPITLPTTLYDMGICAVGTDVYIFGGNDGSAYTRLIYKFDSITETITKLSSTLLYDFFNIGISAVGTDIYLFGGMVAGNSAGYNYIYKFDTSTETLIRLSKTLPHTMSSISTVTIGTDIYLFNGYGFESSSIYYNSLYKFDSITKTITTKYDSTSGGTYGREVGIIGTDIYLLGGYSKGSYGGTWVNTITKYDTIITTSTTLSTALPSNTQDMRACTVDKYIYLFGGYNKNTIMKFTSFVELENNNLLMLTSSEAGSFNILSGDNYMTANPIKVYNGNIENHGYTVEAYLYKDGAWTLI